jgi:hypothetical protein
MVPEIQTYLWKNTILNTGKSPRNGPFSKAIEIEDLEG